MTTAERLEAQCDAIRDLLAAAKHRDKSTSFEDCVEDKLRDLEFWLKRARIDERNANKRNGLSSPVATTPQHA